jgi:hypothetical protein
MQQYALHDRKADLDVRHWPKADMSLCAAHVHF